MYRAIDTPIEANKGFEGANGKGSADAARPHPVERDDALDKMIGQIIHAEQKLTADQVNQVVDHQKKSGLRFGESAVALGLITESDVLYALSQQFHYPYAPVDRLKLNAELVTAADPFSKQSEAFRAIRTQILTRVFKSEGPRSALAIISPNVGDGKTFFAANLAVVLSQLGQRTLLIDADLRGPRLHQVLGQRNGPGLSGILAGRSGDRLVDSVPYFPSLFFMSGGTLPPNPLELIERPAFSILLRELVGKFDYVLLDTPAASHGADATAIAQKCGAALCITRDGKTRLNSLQDLFSTISAGSVKIAGAVLNEF